MNTTTRKYPRTLREAFPFEADYAVAIERTPGGPGRTLNLMTVAALALTVVMLAIMTMILVTPAEDLVQLGADDAQRQARAELRREMAEARMCIEEHGPGVAIIRDVNNRTVCLPRRGVK